MTVRLSHAELVAERIAAFTATAEGRARFAEYLDGLSHRYADDEAMLAYVRRQRSHLVDAARSAGDERPAHTARADEGAAP